jgi:hypothetical protein
VEVTRTGWSQLLTSQVTRSNLNVIECGGAVLIRYFSRTLDAARLTVDQGGRSVLP